MLSGIGEKNRFGNASLLLGEHAPKLQEASEREGLKWLLGVVCTHLPDTHAIQIMALNS